MVFNGGMLASYVVVKQYFGFEQQHLGIDSAPCVLGVQRDHLPYILFRTTVPDSIIESAKIDGAGQFRIWSQIVLPISKPVMATIGMFAAFGYWNDWFQASFVHSGYQAPDFAVPVEPDAEKYRVYRKQSLWRTFHAGIQAVDADRECPHGDCNRNHRTDCMYLSVFSEVLYLWFDNWFCQRVKLVKTAYSGRWRKVRAAGVCEA